MFYCIINVKLFFFKNAVNSNKFNEKSCLQQLEKSSLEQLENRLELLLVGQDIVLDDVDLFGDNIDDNEMAPVDNGNEIASDDSDNEMALDEVKNLLLIIF